MSSYHIRNSVKNLYPHSKVWSNKVDRMSDKQVFAIHMRSVEDQKPERPEDLVPDGQLTLF